MSVQDSKSFTRYNKTHTSSPPPPHSHLFSPSPSLFFSTLFYTHSFTHSMHSLTFELTEPSRSLSLIRVASRLHKFCPRVSWYLHRVFTQRKSLWVRARLLRQISRQPGVKHGESIEASSISRGSLGLPWIKAATSWTTRHTLRPPLILPRLHACDTFP